MAQGWTQQQLAGKTLDVYTPAQKPRFALVYLHPLGLETLAGPEARDTYTPLLEKHNLACVCPHTQRSWWADRICPEFDAELTAEKHVLNNVLPLIRETWGLAAPAVGLFGISMGGQGAIKLALKHAKLFPVVAGISSAFDYQDLYGSGSPLDDMYDSKEQCRQDTAVLQIHPYQYPPHIRFCIDPDDEAWIRGNDRLHEKLMALGIEHVCDLTTQAGGHSWQYFNRMAEPTLQFLVEGLQRESMRLL